MSTARAYKTMVRMFERRSDRLDEAIAQQRRVLRELEQAREQSQAARAACEEAQQRAEGERDAVLTQVFTPEALIVMSLRAEAKAAETRQAAVAVDKSVQKVDEQNVVVAQAQRDQRRNAQRIDLFENARKQVVKAADIAQEENDDEEAAEGFVARMLAKRRAAA
jgi:Bacterial type III secretion protein (HrpB7)